MSLPRLTVAFERLDDFIAVQSAQHGAITVDAVNLLQAAVGLEEDDRAEIRTRVTALGAESAAGAVLLGVLVGLLAAETR